MYGNKRKTIGFLIKVLHNRYQSMICPGILDGAEKYDVNLITFVGKDLNCPSAFQNRENIIYQLANRYNVDGLIIASGSIGNFLTVDKLSEFCRQYAPIPMVCIATPIKGIPSVSVQNEEGMKQVVTHFVREHQYKRIAFIRGPANNPEAELRYKVFRDVLKRHQVPFYPELVYEGDFIWFSGIQCIKTLLDERNVQFDALISSSDEMLVGAHRELVRRGFQIPDDVAIGGQFTTASQPLYLQGMKAVEMLVDQISGKTVPELVEMPSSLIVRKSCGCDIRLSLLGEGLPGTYQINRKAYDIRDRNKEALKDLVYDNLIQDKELQADTPKIFYKDGMEIISRVLDFFLKDLKTPEKNSSFIQEILNATKKNYPDSSFLEFLKILVIKIHRYCSPHFSSSTILSSRIDDLAHGAVYLLLDAMSRQNLNQNKKTRDQNYAMLNVTKTLSTAYTFKELRKLLLELLPTLNISLCFIALYKNGISDMENPAEESSVFLHFQKGRSGESPQVSAVFETSCLMPDGLFDLKERTSLAIYPLVTEDEHFGYIVFDYSPIQDPMVYEAVQGHISSSLKGALLLEKISKRDKRAERNPFPVLY